MMLFRLVKRHYLTNHVDTLTLWNQKKLPNELKKLTFDDIFLGVEGDDGQVARQPGKAGWNIFLESDSNLTFDLFSLSPVYEVGARERVDVPDTKVQRFWSVNWPRTIVTHLFCISDYVEGRIKGFRDVFFTSLYFASLVWMNLAWAPGASP